MRDLDDLFRSLSQSTFRSRFRLNAKDRAYLQSRGLDVILEHAETFVRERLAPANPTNDGKQTPMRGHPVFVAQHATATCCRGCLQKWHRIPRGRAMSDEEQRHVLQTVAAAASDVISNSLKTENKRDCPYLFPTRS